MQTEVPTLPVVHFNNHKNINRKENSNLGRSLVETKSNSSHKNIAYLSSKKKALNPLLGCPYQTNIRQCSTTEQSKLNKNTLEHKVLSAKMLRIKELQNQLADAHYRLNELANENKLLKALQKRQDSALKRYEGTNAELPRIINSHHEELRVLQIKYKKLKVLQKETCDTLKEKENELQHLQTQNKHLLQLSKDRNLGEREKLQLQVSDLNYRIQQQQDTIQALHRKLTVETKSLKQQLQIEISKKKEAQKHLFETTEKLRILEDFLDNRERRLYYNGQLPFPDKIRHLGTQSLTSLRDISTSHPLKLTDKTKKKHSDVPENSLPVLQRYKLNNQNVKDNETPSPNEASDTVKTETMTNLDQIRNYRLQKLPHQKVLIQDTENRPTVDQNSEMTVQIKDSDQLNTLLNDQQYDINEDRCKKKYKNRKYQNFHELLQNNLVYSSEESDSENENFRDNYINTVNNSKQLHTSSADETSDSKEIPFADCKYANKLKVLVKERQNCYESDTEIESKISKESFKQFSTTSHKNDACELPSSTVCGNQNHCNSDKKEKIPVTSGNSTTNRSEQYFENLIGNIHVQTETNENENLYGQFDVKNIQIEYTNSDSERYPLRETIFEKQEYNCVSSTETDNENILLAQTCSTRKDSNEIKIADIKSDMPCTTTSLFKKSGEKNSKHLQLSSNTSDEGVNNYICTTAITEVHRKKSVEHYDFETKNKLNKKELDNAQPNNDTIYNPSIDVSTIIENNTTTKKINYNKEKLLASMKAIDDNENIEFSNEDYEKQCAESTKQITQSMFHNFPAHLQRKQDILKDIFDTDVTESTDSCNKLQ